MSKKWNTKIYKEELANRGIIDIIPLEEYVVSQQKILHKCTKCNQEFLKSPNEIIESSKKRIEICPICSGRKLVKGINTLWDTHPDIAELLANPEDGYTHSKGSNDKLDWICPDCGEIIKEKYIHNTIYNGLICPLCGNTRSKGHRIVNAILSQLNVEYMNEKTFYWSDSKSYDIYIENLSCLIEVHGIQHYEYCNLLIKSGKTLADEQENDRYKEELANMNNIKYYITIDARKSDYNYIINSIKNNNLFNDLFNISKINWDKVLEDISNSDILKICNLYNQGKTVPQIQKIVHMSNTVIQRHLHDFTNVGMCEYKGDKVKEKPVICITTGEEFENLKEAGIKYNIDPNGISFVCRGLRNRKFAGKLNDGTKLKWLFKDDYILKTQEDLDNILNEEYKKSLGKNKVICLNTLEVFDSIKQAKDKYNASSISDCCRHICKSSGKHPITGEQLKWLYYEEYKNTSKEKIAKILNDIDYSDNRVICINTGEIFDNAVIAGKWCGVVQSGICSATNGINITNGKHPVTGESLRWMKYRDYLKLNKINVGNCEKSVAFSMQ